MDRLFQFFPCFLQIILPGLRSIFVIFPPMFTVREGGEVVNVRFGSNFPEILPLTETRRIKFEFFQCWIIKG